MSLFSRSEGKPVLIADIGEASVGVALTTLSKNGPAHVIRSIRETLAPETRTSAQSATAIQALLESIVTKILTQSSVRTNPHAVYAVLRAPWTQFRTSETEEKTPEVHSVTKAILGTLATRALTASKQSDTSAVLEAGVLQVFLNGYPTGEPIGKRANSVKVVAFESTIDPGMKAGIMETLGKLLPGRTPTLYSGTRALLVTLQDHLPHVHRFILIDVGASMSSCAVIRKDNMTDHASIPEGLSTILTRIAPSAVPSETLSLLRMLANETCSTSACADIKEAIARAEPELVRIFGESFASLAAKRRLPDIALLSAPAELSPWLESFFSRIDFSQFTSTTKPLRVESLSPEHLTESVVWEPGLTPETGIGVSASSVNILAHASS
ncbi:MAG: hypothetical protein WAZ27_01695 [Minisyncoccia bacterium]